MMKVTGARDLQRALDRMAREVAEPIAERAMLAGAKPVEDEARRKVPRRTGEGAAAIERAVDPTRKAGGPMRVLVGPSAGTKASRRDGFYLRFVELGTGPRHTDDGAHRGSITRDPFLRPALDAKAGEVIRITRRELARGIEDASR